MVEVDVHRSLDGALVLAHDDALGKPGGRVPIATTPIAELRAIDVGGEPPPLLSEALHVLKGRSGVLIDLKVSGCEDELVATVRRSRMREVMFCGGDLASLLRIRSLAPDIALSWTLSPRQPFTDVSIPVVPTEWATIDHRALAVSSLQAFRQRGVRVLAWTVDSPSRVEQLVAWGVDGITSNDPAMVARVATTRVATPPPSAGEETIS